MIDNFLNLAHNNMQNNQKNKVPFFALLAYWIKNLFFVSTKKWLKRILWLVFNLIIFTLILIVLLIYSPTFQTIAAKLAAEYLSKDIGLQVRIDKLSIDIFHHLNVHGLTIQDHHQDTIVHLNQMNIKIKYNSIFHNKLYIDKITLENPVIKAIRYKGNKDFNYQKLIDYFSSQDTLKHSEDTTRFDFKLYSVELKNATIVYKDEKYNTTVSEQVNYDFLKLTNTDLFITNIKQKKDTLFFVINKLKAKEQSGLALLNMQAHTRITPQSLYFKNLSFQTNKSIVNGNVEINYPSFDAFLSDAEKNMTIDADIHLPTKVHFTDLHHFAKELKGWDSAVEIAGKVKGKIDDLKITHGHINYAGTVIEGDIVMKGLPDIDKTYFIIQAHSMITNAHAIEQIPLYPFDKKEFIELPRQFKNTGITNFKGTIKGYYHHFKVDGILVTQIGDIKLNTQLMIDSVTNDLNYNGNFTFHHFHFGKFFQNKNIGTFTADVLLNGKGTLFKTMKTSIQANINQFFF
ncbi:MAG: hypothetical protein N2203_08140, partial [Bacteroidia bacterium]|nr:hypothetical protein [Bacteroidia bacterium]